MLTSGQPCLPKTVTAEEAVQVIKKGDRVVFTVGVELLSQMLAINATVSVDLTGPITAESIRARLNGGTGGQLAFAIGASLSKGGRSIVVMTSTVHDGTQSRIVPQFGQGTAVSIPRTLADTVIIEYGVARLKGKTERQRAFKLAAIAHPDFRAKLRRAAERLS